MLSKIILFIILLFPLQFFTQNQVNYTVDYVFKVNKELLLEKKNRSDDKFPEMLLMHLKNFEEPTAKLKFSSTNSYYRVDDKLANDKNYKFNFFSERAGGKNEYYCDLSEKKCVYTSSVLKNKGIIYPTKIWKITNETTNILGYTCRKATLENNNEAKIDAWFAVDLPFPFGPYKFNSLPGLVLKVETNNGLFTYLATKINTDETTKIKTADNLEKIEEDEYKQLIKNKNSIFKE